MRAWLAAALLALAGVALLVFADEAQAAPTYHVYATREGLVGGRTSNGHIIVSHDHFVALPSTKNLDCNGCTTYEIKVCNPANGRCAIAPQWDVGPWNTRDDYWNPPSQRASWTDLPQGKPEAQAAYQDGYHWIADCKNLDGTYSGHGGGADQFDRCVLNPAGIDLADGTFWDDLGMTGSAWVDVTFLWMPDADTTPPTTPAIAETHCGSAWTRCDTPRWTWSASDPESGVVAYEVAPSWTSAFTTAATAWQPTLGTGTWSVRVRAEDGAGLWSAWSGWVTTRVDVTPPNVPAPAAASAGVWSNVAAPRVTWTDPGDAGSGVASYARILDGTKATIGDVLTDAPMLADGVHTYALQAIDGVGWSSAPSNALTLKIDTTPPTTALALDAPWTDANGTWVSPATPFALAASDALSGVARTEWSLDGGAWRDYVGPFTLAGLVEGPHTVAWRSADVAGNVEVARSRVVRLDATPPTVRFENPTEGAIVITTGAVEVRAPAADAESGLARVSLFVDGAARPFAWRAGDEALGNHTLVALAVDHVGNVARAIVNVTTLPTSAAGLQATAARLAAAPGEPPPSVRLLVEADPQGPSATVGVEVDGRFYGVRYP
ncbi:MAG: OmpL47-type beta-barrel domain-containing protein [Thermoplasmatota archaeon]